VQYITNIKQKYRQAIRDKAIDKAKVRILLCERDLADFSEEELEIIVQEEEREIYSAIKEKGLLAVLAVLGIGVFG
jgi:type I restriction-modification system DNA methylase subunit